jgi:hypothetical protein
MPLQRGAAPSGDRLRHPAEKHDGRADEIIAARKAGMKRARQQRLKVNRGCREGSDAAYFPAGLGHRLQRRRVHLALHDKYRSVSPIPA